ncbi:MAG: phage holin family protein [Sulfuritalea sp.]|nr:phage holin family protein [Sulfuritalea sp.]
MADAAGGRPEQSGLFASSKGLLGSGIKLRHNRLELLGVELAEERLRLISLLAYGAAALLCIAAGLIFLAVLLTVVLWESHRLLALGVFSAFFLGAGGVSLALAMSRARAGSKLFSGSLAELRKDRDALSARDGGAAQ